MDTTLGVGMIGTGRIADLHVPGYQDHPQGGLVAVCDTEEGVAERRAAEWNVDRHYDDYRKLLDDPDVDAVEILTPHHLHAEMAIAALEAGKHVSVQKPMAISLEECDSMIAAAEASGKQLRVFENFCYYPPLVKAKELLDRGAIGEPRSMRVKTTHGSPSYGWSIPKSTMAWRYEDAKSGGGRMVLDYGHHVFATAIHFLGRVDRVFAYIESSTTAEGWISDSPVVAVWKYRDGIRHGSWEALESSEMVVQSDYYPEDEWFEFTGSRGFIWVNRCTGRLLDQPPVVVYADGETTTVGLNEIDWDWGSSFSAGTRDFVDALVQGTEAPLTGGEARDVYRFSRAAQLSAQEGREVFLAETL